MTEEVSKERVEQLRAFVASLDWCIAQDDRTDLDALLSELLRLRSPTEARGEVMAREAAIRREGAEIGAAALDEIGKMLIAAAAEVRSDEPFASPALYSHPPVREAVDEIKKHLAWALEQLGPNEDYRAKYDAALAAIQVKP